MRLRSRVKQCVVSKVDEKLIEKAKTNKQRNNEGKKILKQLHEEVNEKNRWKARNKKTSRKARNEKKLTPIADDRGSKYSTHHKYERKTSIRRRSTKIRSVKTKRMGLLKKNFPTEPTRSPSNKIYKCKVLIENLKLDKNVQSKPEKKQLNICCGDLPCRCSTVESNHHESSPLEKSLHTKYSKNTQKVLTNNLSGLYWSSNSEISKKSGNYNERRSSQRNATCPRKKLQQVHLPENVVKEDDSYKSLSTRNSKQKSNINILEHYLSSTLDFTLINYKKNVTNVPQQQHQLCNTGISYSQICCHYPNKTELFHKRGRKKLYTCKQGMFAGSPREVKSRSFKPNSNYEFSKTKEGKLKRMDTTLKLPIEDDIDKSSKTKESKSKLMDTTLKSPIEDDIEVNVDRENKQIHTASIETFLDSNLSNELVVSKEVLESIIDKDEDVDIMKSNKKTTSNNSHRKPLKETEQNIENKSKKLTHVPSTNMLGESRKVIHKKKKLLHSKGIKVFDLESNHNEEKMADKMDLTCNKNIMNSVIHFMQ